MLDVKQATKVFSAGTASEHHALNGLNLHLDDGEYGVEQLAQDLCMERTGLYKKLTALTDTTPVAFIRSIRLQRAAALLQEGKLTVNEIAERTGFSSPSYFTKCFKKEFGVLPSEYR